MSKGQRKGKRQPKPRPKQVETAVTPKASHPIRTAMKLLSLVVVAATLIYLAVRWGAIPDQVPTAFDADGVATQFSGKSYLLLCPILGGLMALLVAGMATDARVWRLPFKVKLEVRKKVDAIMSNTMVLLCLELQVIFLILTLSMAESWDPGSFVLTGSLVLVVATVVIGGLLCYRLNSNSSGPEDTSGSNPFSAPPGTLGRR